ncbi:MAG TPA: His/Gly/Thr/Pro-type tRNA ligase C-terminal domain-containing protein, partial [Candidatus Limnocylindria bacterium]|nr:His/Gly/Thr/Pro-type tRNA ligase C-terminal domain-containing protein [Candidatus Limnocylindria bacterium]
AEAVESVQKSLSDVMTASGPLRVKVDWREESPGFKYSHWEMRGVPYRLEIGPRDVAAGNGVLVRRVDRDKQTVALSALAAELPTRMADYQAMLFQRALDFRAANTHNADTYDEFKQVLESVGGFLMAPWCGSAQCEKQLNADTGATIRCIPFDSPDEAGKCIVDGKPSERRALMARAY